MLISHFLCADFPLSLQSSTNLCYQESFDAHSAESAFLSLCASFVHNTQDLVRKMQPNWHKQLSRCCSEWKIRCVECRLINSCHMSLLKFIYSIIFSNLFNLVSWKVEANPRNTEYKTGELTPVQLRAHFTFIHTYREFIVGNSLIIVSNYWKWVCTYSHLWVNLHSQSAFLHV